MHSSDIRDLASSVPEMRLLVSIGASDPIETRMRRVPMLGDRVVDLIEPAEYVVTEVRAPCDLKNESGLYVVRVRPRATRP